MSIVIRTTALVEVFTKRRVSDAWKATTRLRWRSDTADCLLPQIRRAAFVWDSGAYAGAYPLPFFSDAIDDYIGALVKVTFDGADGFIGIITGVDSTLDLAPATQPSGANEVVSAVGIEQILDQLIIKRGATLVGSTVCDPGACPIFNDRATCGFRSSASHSVNGLSVPIFDQRPESIAQLWDADQVLAHVFALAGNSTAWPALAGGGLSVVLSDPTNSLFYQPPPINLDGQSLLSAIMSLVSRERGLWARAQITDGGTSITITIQVGTGIASAIGSTPANANQVSLDFGGSPWISDLRITRDSSGVADVIEVRGQPALAAITFFYHASNNDPLGTAPSLEKGWDSTAETAWNADPNDPRAQDVWRRWLVKADWVGKHYNSANGLQGGASPLTGTATRSNIAGTASRVGNGRAIMLSGDLPWSASQTEINAANLPRAKPIVFTGRIDNNTSWQLRQWTVAIDRGPAAIILDDGDQGRQIFAALTGSTGLAVTVGVRESDPVRVQYSRPNIRNPLPRVFVIQTAHELWYCSAGVADGVTGGVLQTQAATVIRDDRAKLVDALALAQAWHAQDAVTATWVDRGTAVPAQTCGALVKTIGAGRTVVTCNAVVSQVNRSLLNGDGQRIDCSYATDIILPGLKGAT